MSAAAPVLPASGPKPDPDRIDQRVTLRGVGWEDYEAILRARGERGGVRVTFLEGVLELMSPSIFHESDKKKLARLVEAFAEETDVPLEGYGSWTVRKREAERGAEPDECYVLGSGDGEASERPQIAIEVVWTGGGIDKLEVWRGLGVPEVWFWQDGALAFFALRGDRYEKIPRSAMLAGLDPALVAECMGAPSQTEAVRTLRSRLRGQSKG